jgi:hypothetical protein
MMDEIDRKQLYNAAWKHWGSDSQLDMCIEEMCEFIHAILGTRRHGVTYSYAFFEEMADVLICLEQVEIRLKDFPHGIQNGKPTMTSWDKVQEIKEMKLLRLKERLEDSMANKNKRATCKECGNELIGDYERRLGFCLVCHEELSGAEH